MNDKPFDSEAKIMEILWDRGPSSAKDGRRGYAEALLECASGKTLFASAFGGAKVKTRIENVISFRKTTVLSAVAFTALAAVIVFALVTNAG